MNTIKLRTPYSVKCEQDARDRKEKVWTIAGSIIAALFIGLALFLLSGCTTTSPNNPPLSKALVTIAVSTGVSFGVEQYPEAVPYLRVATPIVCSAAAGTNIQPAEIVQALTKAGITNSHAKLIINSALAIYVTVFDYYGSSWQTNQVQLQGYVQALCDGLNLGLPPDGPNSLIDKHMKAKKLPPHLL